MTDSTPRDAKPSSPDGEGAPARLVAPEDREAAVSRLSAAFARDVLTVDEFERRAAAVYRATTSTSLAELTSDLPAETAQTGEATPARAGSGPVMPPRVSTVLGNLERSGHVIVPSRVEVRTVLGNIELDLRDAEFGPGITEIAVRSILGNVEIMLPEDMPVENHGGAFLGSFAARAKRGAPPPDASSARSIRLTGRAVLGNVEFGSRGPPR